MSRPACPLPPPPIGPIQDCSLLSLPHCLPLRYFVMCRSFVTTFPPSMLYVIVLPLHRTEVHLDHVAERV